MTYENVRVNEIDWHFVHLNEKNRKSELSIHINSILLGTQIHTARPFGKTSNNRI